ncbi:hypothetical protein [Halorubrum trapanicum]|uniref:hypothetical protein n=1 Tax=Halorubrum trapanicum TaxID=29284 RepID=UPI003C6F58BB
MSDRGAQRAHRALAAGALAVFSVDLRSIIYKRAAGALAVFAVDLRSIIYKRAAGALAVFVAASLFVYKWPQAI